MIAGYGLIYTHQFTSSVSGLKEQFRIYENGVSDNNVDIGAAGDPITSNRSGNADSSRPFDLTVAYETVTFSFMAENSVFEHTNFANADEEKYLGVRLMWNGSSWDEKFRGFMSPEFYRQELKAPPLNVSLSFTNRLGDLQNYEYVNEDIYTSSDHDGKKTQLDVLLYCLDRLNMDMSGIRVSTRYMESNIDSAATDSAFKQIYVDPYSYYDINDNGLITSSFTLSEVIDSILKPYSATLYAYADYYWIVEQEELASDEFTYVEYNMSGTYVTNATQSNSLSFKAVGSTDYWRWAGTQSLTFSPVYNYVKITLDGKVIARGLQPSFVGKNAFKLGVLGFQDFTGTSLSIGNTFDSVIHGGRPYITDEDRQVVYYEAGITQITPDDYTPLRWTFSFRDTNSSNTYIRKTDELQYTSGDKFNIKVDLQVRPSYSSGYTEPLISWPYYVMPWVFKVGTYYYNSTTKSWSTTATTNQYFITQAGEDTTIDLDISLRDVSETATYEVDIYIPTRHHNDLGDNTDTSEANMITALKAIATTGLTEGARKITRYESNNSIPTWEYYFYELLENLDSGSEPNVVDPTDYHASTNDKRWQLVEQKTLHGISNSVTEVNALELRFLPNGDEPPDDIIQKTASSSNSVTLEDAVYHFDAPTEVNSSELLYYNRLCYLDSTFQPTEDWTDGATTQTIQEHRMDYLESMGKQIRQRVQGATLVHDVEIPPFMSFLNPSNLSRRFIMPNQTINHKGGMISGDMVEVYNEVGADETFDGVAETFGGVAETFGN